jgi:hypothetical protein
MWQDYGRFSTAFADATLSPASAWVDPADVTACEEGTGLQGYSAKADARDGILARGRILPYKRRIALWICSM